MSARIKITPILPSMKGDLISHMRTFGRIAQYWFHNGHNCSICIVVFKDDKVAHNLLEKRYHRIHNYILTFEPDEKLLEPNRLNAPLFDEKTWVNIIKYLDNINVCSMAGTSAYLKWIVEKNVSSRFQNISLRLGDSESKKVFATFGRLARTLDVDVANPRRFFEFFTQTCDQHLLDLNLWIHDAINTQLDGTTKDKLKQIFSRLTHLEIACETFFDSKTTDELMAACVSLQSLAINCTSETYMVWNDLNVRFPKLKLLRLELNYAINDDGLATMLALNPFIKELYIDECTNLSSNTMNIITRYLPDLKRITLGTIQNICMENMQKLANLVQLQKVRMIKQTTAIDDINKANANIEDLELWYVKFDDGLIEKVVQMKTVRRLVLCGNVTDNHLRLIVNQLPLLAELQLIELNLVTIERLKHVMNGARNLVYLQLVNMENINAEVVYQLRGTSKYCKRNRLKLDIRNLPE